MPKVELIFFGGCPNVDVARSALKEAGIKDFVEVNQDSLGEEDPYKQFSSPAIVFDGEIIAGSRNGGAACSIISWEKVGKSLAKRFLQSTHSPSTKV